jgi:S-adenosyl methyltransferase
MVPIWEDLRMSEEPSWVPAGVDTKKANIARVYDYWLGGTHNFLADQDTARAIAAVAPNAPLVGLANRAFLSRAVRYLAASGGLVFIPQWRPDNPADVPPDPRSYGGLVGVGRKS